MLYQWRASCSLFAGTFLCTVDTRAKEKLMQARTLGIASFAMMATLLGAACSQDLPTAAPDQPLFAHESNNSADLSGMQGSTTITGKAIINYAKGAPKEWRSSVNVQGNLQPGTYTFAVNLVIPTQGGVQPGQFQRICTFTVSGKGGRQGCSADTDLGGFSMVFILDSADNIVASGTFDRRGGMRFP
ncbi:hypothetical protein BH23GEM5_BH23GEM5_13550 [soil metagenome]